MLKVRPTNLAVLLSTALLVSTTTVTFAETASDQTATTKSVQSVGAKDRAFVKEASEAGLAEVTLGKIAESKASSDSVKQFASQMVKDHSEANEKLKALADAKGLTVSDELNPHHKKAQTKLEKLSGAKFDKEYMNAQREDHKKAVSLFKKQSEKGTDPDLKNFASTTLPTLENHKHMADSKPEKTAAK